MTKTVLFMAAGLVAFAANAQSVQMAKHAVARADQNFSTQAVAVEKAKAPQLNVTLAEQMGEGVDVAPLTSAANGVYYKQPAGTMYMQWDVDGRGYGADFVMYQAYGDVVFYDECKTPKNSKWTLNSTSMNDYVEEDGRTLVWNAPSLQDGYAYPMLTLANGRYSYTLCEEGRLYQQGYTTRMTATPGITPLGFLTDHNSAAGYYGWSGFNTRHYLYGTGSYVDEESGAELTFVGCQETLPAPMSPLYVESIDMPCYTFTAAEAIPAGQELTLDIYVGEAEEPTYTLTAAAEDFTYTLDETGVAESIDSDYGTLYVGNVHFAIKGEDAFGTATEEPFVLNDSCTVVLTGINGEGVDVGFGAYQNYDPDALQSAYILLSDGTSIRFRSEFQFKVVFNAMFDQIMNRGDVEATDGSTYPSYYVKIAEDGTGSTNAIFSDLDGALFYTGSEWYNEDGDENYSMYMPDNFPTWITGLTVAQYGEVEEGDIADIYTVGFTAEPLPADVAGRGYFVYLQGRGIVCELPIFAYQGDIEAAWEDAQSTGIKAVRVETKKANAVNLFGQPVSADYKGIVIADGQKQIRF